MTYCREGLRLSFNSSLFIFLTFSVSLPSTFTSLFPLPPSFFSPEDWEILLCPIKETGALQSEKYNIIRIIRGNVWIWHRFWISVNQIFYDSEGITFFFHAFISFSQFLPDTANKSLCPLPYPHPESVSFSSLSLPSHSLFPAFSCSALPRQRKTA